MKPLFNSIQNGFFIKISYAKDSVTEKRFGDEWNSFEERQKSKAVF